MNKTEMAMKLAKKAGISQAKAAEILDIVFAAQPGKGLIATALDAGLIQGRLECGGIVLLIVVDRSELFNIEYAVRPWMTRDNLQCPWRAPASRSTTAIVYPQLVVAWCQIVGQDGGERPRPELVRMHNQVLSRVAQQYHRMFPCRQR